MSKSVLVRRLGLVIAIAAGLPGAAEAQLASAPQNPWVSRDIGSSTLAGQSVFTTDQLTISAGGAFISDATDQFRFVYQTLSGDVKISARLDSLTPAHVWSHAGLMIRSSLEPDAAQVAVLATGDGGSALRSRRQAGGLATLLSGPETAGAPRWLALERAGTRVTAYSSPDGTTWTTIGSESIELGADVHVGIAVTGYDASQSTLAGISQVWIGGLPEGMRHRDIGGPAVAGNAWHTQGTFTVTSGGAAAADTQDQFHFVYRRVQGDADVVARVASLTGGDRRAKAGVMIRESLTADSRQASVLVSSENGYTFDRRVDPGGLTEQTDGGPGGVPGWVRLVRRGENFEAFRSGDGLEWTSIGTARIAAESSVYVGLAVIAARTEGTVAISAEVKATLDGVSIASTLETSDPSPKDLPDLPTADLPTPSLPTLPPIVTMTSPANGATFTAPATVSMSALAADPELRMARVEFYAGSTLLGTDTSSPYSFTWSSVAAGSYTLTAVAHDADGGQATSGAVSITVQAGPNQPPAAALTSPANNATFTAPATVTLNASASDPENRLARVEFYRGSTLLGTDTSAPYSFTWSSAPAGSYTLTAVASDADGGTTTSSAVSITVQPNQPPAAALTSPANNATFTAPATITLAASASDPESQLARVEFYRGSTLLGTDSSSPYSFTWSSVAAGSYTLTAVAFDAHGGQTTSSAVSITVQAPNQSPTVALTSPANGATFTAPASITLNASASDPENRLARVEFYRGSTLLGTATAAPYSFTWSSAPAGSYTLTAVATDADGGTTTSSAVSITVQGPNQPPAVTLTSPANGATFAAAATITLTASASDPENRLARVEFYRNGTLLGADTSSPYSFTWSSAPAGSYSLTAVASDADGGTTTSSAVSITVQGPNQPPAVTLTSPANGSTFTAPATVTLTASASDPENRLARVEFYRNGALLGTDSSSPYSFTWSSAPAGSHTLTAVAFDSDGGQTTSAAVTITGSTAPPPPPRQIVVTASTDHDDHVTSYLLEIFANGADPETASAVASSDLGKPTPDANRDITVDLVSFFNALAPGNYIATVTAIGPEGSARSTPTAFSR